MIVTGFDVTILKIFKRVVTFEKKTKTKMSAENDWKFMAEAVGGGNVCPSATWKVVIPLTRRDTCKKL